MANFGCAEDPTTTPEPNEDTEFGIQSILSLATPEDSNPEIIRFVPNSDHEALFVSSKTNQITIVDYTSESFQFGQSFTLEPGSATAEFTSLDMSPSGTVAAVTVADAECARGWVLFVDWKSGTILHRVEVGYNPDSIDFSDDGNWAVVANEDDREDRPCKPEGRHGGSISVLDLRNGIESATVAQEIPVDHEEDSEPEGVKIASDNRTVIVAIQETSEIGILNLDDVPYATLNITKLPQEEGENAQPDGLATSPNGEWAMVAGERNGTLSMVSLSSGSVVSTTLIESDVPSPPYNVDRRKTTKRTEPEECRLIERDGRVFGLVALQESHAVIVYDMTDPSSPVFDSIAPVGVEYESDVNMEKSSVGPEGLDVHPVSGCVFVANEREGSITMPSPTW